MKGKVFDIRHSNSGADLPTLVIAYSLERALEAFRKTNPKAEIYSIERLVDHSVIINLDPVSDLP